MKDNRKYAHDIIWALKKEKCIGEVFPRSGRHAAVCNAIVAHADRERRRVRRALVGAQVDLGVLAFELKQDGHRRQVARLYRARQRIDAATRAPRRK